MRTYRRLVAVAALSSLAASGCTGLPSFRPAAQTTPLGVAQPGPMTKLANAVAESKVGKSVSRAWQAKMKRPSPKNDPTAISTGIVQPKAGDYVAMGESLEQEGNGEGARGMFHKALEMEPHHLGALIGLGRHFDRQGQLDRAGEHYLEATRFHPDDPTAFNDLGLCYARQGEYDDAVKALSRAIELQPDRALYRNNIAMVLVAQGRIDEALAHLTDAHGPAVAHYNLGFLLTKQGHNSAALEQFQLALKCDPAMGAARDWVAALMEQPTGHNGQAIVSASEPIESENEITSVESSLNEYPRERENVASRGISPPLEQVEGSNLQPLPPVGGSASQTFRR